MNALKATVMQGRLVLKAPVDWPDNADVLIEPTTTPPGKFGLDESECRGVPESLVDREVRIKMIEPVEFIPDEAKRITEFTETLRQHNVDAVWRQMQEGVIEWLSGIHS